MRAQIYDNHLESEVLAADPLTLVRLLYRGAVDAIATARQSLSAGDIAGRSRAITKAQTILNELALSLDHEKGGELSRSLVELYDYVQRLLLDANVRQVEPPLVEAASLLQTLLEAWETCAAAPAPAARPRAYGAEESEYVPISLAG